MKIKMFLAAMFLVILMWFMIDLFFACTLLKVSLFTHVEMYVYIIFSIISLLIALLLSFLLLHRFKKEHSLVWFFNDHFQGFITTFFFVLVFINSIQKEITIGADKAKDFLNIQWTIFGITIGAFAVWHALIFNKIYFKNEEPTLLEDNDSVQAQSLNNFLTLSEKHSSYQDYIKKIDPLVFILINLITLIFSTGALYLSKDYSLVVESFTLFSFYWSTNTLINVIFDISIDLFSRRRELLKTTKVKVSDYNDAFNSMKAYLLIEEFAKDNTFSNLQNIQIKDEKIQTSIERLSFIVEEYKKDANSFEQHKVEFLALIDNIKMLQKRFKKLSKKKEIKKNASEDEKL